MSMRLSALLPLTIASTAAFAQIDSGGGKTSGGGVYNHGSIGGVVASNVTQGGASTNHPGLVEVLYPITPASITDVNENNLADGWEIGNFGSLGVDPDADADHDGSNNRMEFLAGTDPNSKASFFRPQGSYANGLFQMPIQTVVGRSYKVWVTRDMKTWTHHSTITGDGTTKTYQFDETTITSGPLHSPTHPSKYFFRIEILIP